MKTKKAEKLFLLMKKYDIEHFKTEELEIKMSSKPVAEKHKEIVNKSKKGDIATKPIPLQSAPPVDMKIPHHENEVAKLLKLSDNDLVDALFPEQGAS
jgi:hypothetical protein